MLQFEPSESAGNINADFWHLVWSLLPESNDQFLLPAEAHLQTRDSGSVVVISLDEVHSPRDQVKRRQMSPARVNYCIFRNEMCIFVNGLVLESKGVFQIKDRSVLDIYFVSFDCRLCVVEHSLETHYLAIQNLRFIDVRTAHSYCLFWHLLTRGLLIRWVFKARGIQ